MTPDKYLECLTRGIRNPPPIEGLFGRIVRGKTDEDFRRLAYGDRRLAWVNDSAWLRNLLVDRPAWAEVVCDLGKDADWLKTKIAAGNRWRLILVPRLACEVADWAGAFRLIDRYYREVAAKVFRWKEQISTTSAQQLLGSRYQAYYDAKEPGSGPYHMSLERYLTADDTAEHARVFLWHSLGMNEDFNGTGRKRDGTHEYLAENIELGPDARVLEVRVELPE